MAESPKENSSSVDFLAGIVAELPKKNLPSIDLFAIIATAVINVEGSIPSSEDASGENIKRKLNRGDSPKYCNSPKRVQFVMQPSLDQEEDNVSDIVVIFMAPIPTAMQSIITKAMGLLAL
jgi:hypothetical protein